MVEERRIESNYARISYNHENAIVATNITIYIEDIPDIFTYTPNALGLGLPRVYLKHKDITICIKNPKEFAYWLIEKVNEFEEIFSLQESVNGKR